MCNVQTLPKNKMLLVIGCENTICKAAAQTAADTCQVGQVCGPKVAVQIAADIKIPYSAVLSYIWSVLSESLHRRIYLILNSAF